MPYEPPSSKASQMVKTANIMNGSAGTATVDLNPTAAHPEFGDTCNACTRKNWKMNEARETNVNPP